jgi:LemA protein
VEVARKYMAHESRTLEAVIAARNQASVAEQKAAATPLNPAALGALAGAESALGGALGRLFAVVEDYPELKADQTLRELSEELTHTENRVGFARQAYNDQVLEYNDAALHFPTLIVARLLGFMPLEMLAATQNDEERQAPRVTL